MIRRAALDTHVDAQPLALLKLVEREGLEGVPSDDRIDEEKPPQREGRRQEEHRPRTHGLSLPAEPRGCAPHNEHHDDERHAYPEAHLWRVAGKSEAAERRDLEAEVDAERDSDRHALEESRHFVGQMHLVDGANLAGDHVEADEDLELVPRRGHVDVLGNVRLQPLW